MKTGLSLMDYEQSLVKREEYLLALATNRVKDAHERQALAVKQCKEAEIRREAGNAKALAEWEANQIRKREEAIKEKWRQFAGNCFAAIFIIPLALIVFLLIMGPIAYILVGSPIGLAVAIVAFAAMSGSKS